MYKIIIILFVVIIAHLSFAQTQIDTIYYFSPLDSVRFWAQLPATYDPVHPPAILIWWHQLGGSYLEMRDFTGFPTEANHRGWIAASHMGPNDRHWNTRRAQEQCRAMLDWIMQRYPFSRDSIYMIGGSMGGAAPQVWHNNNCGIHDYLIAAAAGGSEILDCQLRQEQYLATGDTNRSMRAAFGGLPVDGNVPSFEYHRYSAIYLADTSRSMHYNSLHLPVWNSWGNSDNERFAYGVEAQRWDSIRRGLGADTTVTFESRFSAGHGLQVMAADTVCAWLSGFSANRYPNTLNISADESGEYYWTRASLAQQDTLLGRYLARRDDQHRQLDITLQQNVQSIIIEIDDRRPVHMDSLNCSFRNLDRAILETTVTLDSVPRYWTIWRISGSLLSHAYHDGEAVFVFAGETSFTLDFRDAAGNNENSIPTTIRLLSAYPNPFNSTTMFEIESNRDGARELLIYDLLGRVAATKPLTLHPGLQQIPLNAGNLSTGTYFVKLSGTSVAPLRIILLK